MSERVIHGTWASALAEHAPETPRDSRRRPILGGEALFVEAPQAPPESATEPDPDSARPIPEADGIGFTEGSGAP